MQKQKFTPEQLKMLQAYRIMLKVAQRIIEKRKLFEAKQKPAS